MKLTKNLFLLLLLFLGNMILYAQCSVNAGGNTTICGTSYTLQGSSSGSTSGTPVWTLISKPAGAPDPVISDVNSLTPNVTGMTFPGNYVFQLAQNCSPSGSATSQVTITAPGATIGFTAGPDITNIPATTGIANLSATIPTGYTPSWTYYNLNTFEFNTSVVTTNATMTGTTTATPTLTLTKKADHDIDPVYLVRLRITSTNNPSCWYEDDAIVRFIPNPNVSYPSSRSFCGSPSTSPNIRYYYDENPSSPQFSDNTTNASANPSFGTTITMNVISQPSGGNLAYDRMQNGRVYFASSFNQTVGAYVFTLTITNANGSYTTQQLTFNYNGSEPQPISFVDTAYPEQMALYSPGNSAGAVYCNRAGTTTPITINFKINPLDSPTLTSTVSTSTIIPPGGAPGIVISGAGTMNRAATLTPPSGGWRVGTYSFSVTVSNGTCARNHSYYVHISDGNRPNVVVNDMTVCYPGSGVVSATIPLPAIYKGVVDPSYFQDYGGRYEFTVVSKPAGSATPTFDATTLRTFTNTSTVISNLNMQGEYVFKMTAAPPPGGDPGFIQKEYACSGTTYEDTFSVFVSTQVGANAGSAQTVIGATQTTFNANNPSPSTGAWTLLTKPAGATDPVIASPSAYNTNVTGFNTPGTYTFRWTVTTGNCTSTSDLTVNVMAAAAGGVYGADFWVKSDDAGTIATAWKDQSANADNIPNVGGVTLSPADRAHNFHPYTTGYSASKYFYNTNSQLNSTNNYLDPSMRSSVSIFSAVRPTSANGTGRITGIDDDTSAAEPGISVNSGIPYIYKYFGNGVAQTNSNTMSAANAFTANKSSVFSAIQDQALNSGRGERRLGLDGIYESFNLGSTTNTFNVLGKYLRIGYATWDVNGAFPGDIMEILWFKRALTTNEQSRVNSYLAVKNGTTLNENYLTTTSSVVWDRTNNTGYNNNIFGIARDNATALHQKQSGSTNIGQKLVLSTTGFADSNIANTTGLASDLQFLMTGDNGLQQSLKVPFVYTAGSNGVTNYRFESIWKIQNSGTVGTVTVAWPKSVKNLYLVQSPDVFFDGTDTFSPMATEIIVGGVVYNTVNVTLTDGQFFTFAGFVQAPGGVLGPDFWVRSDDAGTISTAWKDNSPNADNIPNVGGVTLSAADRNHNFHPYTTGYTNSKYFLNTTSVMNPLGNVELANTNTSIFSAVRPTTATGTGRIAGIDNDVTNAAEPGMSIASGKPRQYEFWNTTTTSDFSTTFNGGISNVFSAIANNTVANGGTSAIAGGEKRLGLNGSYESFSGFAAANKFQIYGTNLIVGYGSYDAVGAFPGDIMEVAWYNRLLTADEQSRVNSYLAVKNGTTSNENYLATNSNVVWDRAINIGYNNNIFGIAKDEFTALNQKQSGSVNNGQKLVLSTTGFADNNVANNTDLANDMQYLMTGDNDLKQSLTTPLSYTAGSNGVTNYRFESIWKVQNSGSVGTVTVAWPKSVKNLYLVQSTDAVFDGTDTFTPMTTEVTVNGVVYSTVNVTLGNGQFFTFAGFGNAPGGVVNGLSYWYRADKNATNTGATTDVTGWTDIWSGATVAQMGTNALPKYATGTSTYFNFNPGINFTAGTQSLGNTNVRTFSADSYDVFTFTKEGMTSGGNYPSIFRSLVDNAFLSGDLRRWDGLAIQMNNQMERLSNTGGNTDTGLFTPAGAFSTTIPSIMYHTLTATTTTKALNGAANFATTNHTGTGIRNLNGGHLFGDSKYTISGVDNGSDNRGFIGHLGETIIYGSGNLTATERRRVDSYLAIKYGITLGQINTHYLNADAAIVWNGATDTTYNNNIFGVAREDIGLFEQKVSTSVNSGTILTVATTTDFVNPNDNAARTGFAQDKTYLLLGDNNNVTIAPVDITVGSSAYKRIQRIWLAQEKDADAGALFFEADLTAYNSGSFNTTENIVMLVADDAAFTTNVVVVPSTSNIASKWVFNQNVGDGKFITFAKSFPADIQVNKVGPISALAGSSISYTINVTNNGPNNATNVIIKDPAVANFTVTGVTCTAGTGTGGSANCPVSVTVAGLQGASGLTIPTLPEGSGVTFTVTGTVGNTVGAVITNTATAEYAEDVDTAYNSSTVNTTIYGCTSDESTYMIDADATLAANTIAVNGGTVNLIYKLTSGTAVPGIGTQFTLPIQYSDLNNKLGVDNQWESLGVLTIGSNKYFDILPKATNGVGGWYNNLPANNIGNESLLSPDNGTDNIFTTKIGNGELDPLGKFSIKMGNYPVTPTGYVVKSENFRTYANGNRISDGVTNKTGFWLKPLIQTNIANSSVAIYSNKLMPGDTYVWRYSAFGSTGNYVSATTGGLKGLLFIYDNYITFAKVCDAFCYKPDITTGTVLDTKMGITALNRAGAANADNWPMVRKGGWLALESKTKAFVPNRVAFSGGNPVGIAPANFVEGMMVYDTTNKCMKMYSSTDNGATFGWYCISTQTCPD